MGSTGKRADLPATEDPPQQTPYGWARFTFRIDSTVTLRIRYPVWSCLLTVPLVILPEYLQTVFVAEVFPAGWAETFAIITAANPGGVNYSPAENELADSRLQRALEDTGFPLLRIVGCSPDLVHREQSWAVAGLLLLESLRIAKEFGQNAVFWVDQGWLYVVSCADGDQRRMGSFLDRLTLTTGS